MARRESRRLSPIAAEPAYIADTPRSRMNQTKSLWLREGRKRRPKTFRTAAVKVADFGPWIGREECIAVEPDLWF
jgi:hypothetical protein